MCLIAFHWQPADPQTPDLIVAANRDEFYQRPAHPMAEWPEYPGLFAGKDLEQGGTWLGVTAQGRFAALTNIRAQSPNTSSLLSRGHLVLNFLTTSISAADYMAKLANNAAHYGLFNLLCGDGSSLWYAHNHPQFDCQPLPPGLYGLSNAHLNTPWPKTELAKQQLNDWLQHSSQPPINPSLPSRLLSRREPFADTLLPNTGVPPLWEKWLSSQFIHTPTYGTRCSTAISIRQASISLEEISWDKHGQMQHCYQHQIER